MAKPRKSSWGKLKRLARYLLEAPRLVWRFEGKEAEADIEIIEVYSDSDWAGCLQTRRSTSGGLVTIGGGTLKSWASTQMVVAQSSGEAEYYAMTKAAAEGLGVQALMEDLGWKAKVRVWVDSSVAKSVASRVGLGKLCQMEVKFLWLQQAVRDGRNAVKKVPGQRNPADVLTKPLARDDFSAKLATVGGEVVGHQ